MAEFLVMPKLGFDMNEGVLVSWMKGIGDAVESGEVIAEIESDKATLELEAQVTGIVLKLLAQEGDVVPIGDNIAIVGVGSGGDYKLEQEVQFENIPDEADQMPVQELCIKNRACLKEIWTPSNNQ